MCFAINTENKNDLKKQLELWTTVELDTLGWTPARWVDAFTFPLVPVLLKDKNLELHRWGLIPSWVRGEEQARDIRTKTLNARCETLFTLPSFKDSARLRRGLVAVNGFYEYQHRDAGKVKVPYKIGVKGKEAFFLACIWAEYRNEKTFSIITMPSNTLMSEIHNSKLRQPVIVEDAMVDTWFNGTTEEQLQILFTPSDEIPLLAEETEGKPRNH